ncbi:MAG: hypothetical protein ACOCUU_00675 [Nanoarchaeota archaeon]
MKQISLKQVSLGSKTLLLKELGYNSDGDFVLDKEGKKVMDRYVDIPIRIDSMIILPGSTIILDDNELSVMKYMEEFGDDL